MEYNTIISAQDLKTIIDKDNVRVFDCRFSLKDPQGGLKSYQAVFNDDKNIRTSSAA